MRTPAGLLRGAAAAARYGALSSVQTTRWSVSTTIHLTQFAVRSVRDGTPPDAIAAAALRELRQAIALPPGEPGREAVSAVIAEHANGNQPTEDLSLPERMAALLDASADVDVALRSHPAYFKLLNELAPDEARILRLLAQRGPQAALDVRTKRLFGAGSDLLASGITMIGGYAGLADKERVPAYLNNLSRLGLLRISSEMLHDEEVYHLLEAQPEVLERFKHQKIDTIPGRVELTPFGQDLCLLCGLLPPASPQRALPR